MFKFYLKFKKVKNTNNQKGYVTLLMMLIVSAVSFATILYILESSVNKSQNALALVGSTKADSYANACIEEALYSLSKDNSITNFSSCKFFNSTAACNISSINSSEYCSYSITKNTSSNTSIWNIVATGVSGDSTKNLYSSNELTDSGLVTIDWGDNVSLSNFGNFTLNYSAGINGSIQDGNVSETVPFRGNGPEVTAVADSGYHFVDWSDLSIFNPRIDRNILSNISAIANFKVDSNTPLYTVVHNNSFYLKTNMPSGMSLNLADDQVSDIINLPFDFNFFGVKYSQIRISSNGFIIFNDNNPANNSSACCSGYHLPNTNHPTNIIAAYWTDLYPQDGRVFYESFGTAPNRYFVVEFRDVPVCCSLANKKVNFQIKLFESSNIIEIDTPSAVLGQDGHIVTQGIENADGSAAYVVSEDRNSNAARNFSLTRDSVRFYPN